MKITIHAGHTAPGKPYCGAVGLLDESKEARKIKDAVIKYLKNENITVVDCTVSTGTSQKNVLEQICKKCNEADADLNISIHLNSGRDDCSGDGKQGGFECYALNYTDCKLEVSNRIVTNMKELGFNTHGAPLKLSNSLYFLKNTKKPSLLLEICFVDDTDDYNQYIKVGSDTVGKAIAAAVSNKSITKDTKEEDIKMANVFQYTLDGGDKQKWHPEFVGGDKLMLRNKYNGEYLDLSGANGSNGTNVQTYKKNSSIAQQWQLKKVNGGYNPADVAPYEIVTMVDKTKRLDIKSASKGNNANLQIWTSDKGQQQRFSIIDTGDGYWCIVNVNSLKALTV